jgi:hypothetical protein
MFSFTSNMFDVNDIVRPDVQYPLSQGQGGGNVHAERRRQAERCRRVGATRQVAGDQQSARWQEAT